MFTGSFQWKEGLQQKASEAFLRQQQATPNLRKLVYGTGTKDPFNLVDRSLYGQANHVFCNCVVIIYYFIFCVLFFFSLHGCVLCWQCVSTRSGKFIQNWQPRVGKWLTPALLQSIEVILLS